MVEQPTIQSADTDGNGPAKRRRRPALSCVECRLRKVKCDRRKPCGACTRIKSTTCTYRPQRPGIRSQSEQSPEGATSASHSNEPEAEISARSSPQPSGPATEFDAMVNRYVAPGVFGEHDKLKPLPTGRPCFNLSSQPDNEQNAIVSSLLDRIHGLEEKLASTTLGDQARSSTLPARESPGKASGQLLRSKIYGQSHWANVINPVSRAVRQSG